MDSLLSPSADPRTSGININPESFKNSSKNIDLVIVQNIRNENSDKVSLSFDELYKGLSLTGRNIIDKLNELLKEKLPAGIQSLNPEDVTPEATANRIVKGSTAFFEVFAKQNPNLSGEELLNKFMSTIRGGIKSGYEDAASTLEGLGAFEFDGVKEGIEETMRLVEEKLNAFESSKREELGINSKVEENSAEFTKTEVLKTAAGSLSIVA